MATTDTTDTAAAAAVPTIADFYAHKNVFITGGTGFLGTVLIEAILAASPDVGKIYLLVRDKYGSNATSRIQRMVTKPLFKAHSAETLAKIVPVIGELSAPKFGMSDDDYQTLADNVNLIYHSAATIKFKSHIRTAIDTNVTGTMRTVEFAKALKSLAAYVYVSTAFCNTNHRGFIKELVYESEQCPYEMMRLAADDANWTDAVDVEALTAKLCGGHPNTYTFTKQLGENLIKREMSGMAAGIMRPSVVYGTYEYPIQGWVGNANSGHLGFLAGFTKGLFRTMTGNPSSVIDCIPCDYVINATVVLGWYVGTRPLETPEVIHCTSGETNPITLQNFHEMVNAKAHVNPNDALVWLPNTKIRNGWRYQVFFMLFHYLPWALMYVPELLFPVGKRHHTAFTYMRVFDKGTKAFSYFLNKEFRYSLQNSLRLMSMLPEADAKRYSFDAANCDWSEFIERQMLGIRRYYFRESFHTSVYHRIMYKIFQVMNYVGWVGILALIYFAVLPVFGSSTVSLGVALSVWVFLLWL